MENFYMENDMEQFDFDVFKEQLKIKYNNVDFKYFRQLFDLACELDYGTDVYVGGDYEYCQTQNIDNKKKYYGYIIEMYDQLKTFESDIQKDIQIIKNTRGYDSIRSYDRDIIANLDLLYSICEIYHDKIERIREKLDSPKINPLPKNNLSYFYRSFSETEQKKLFAGLTNGGFLPKDTNYSHFCHVFGGMAIPEKEKPFKPIVWQKSKSLLAYFVVGMCEKYNLKHGEKRMLKPFENMFDVSGLSGVINDIKKVQTPPVGYEKIDEILKLSKIFFNDNFMSDK